MQISAGKSKKKRPDPKFHRLLIEMLEDRRLLAVTVTEDFPSPNWVSPGPTGMQGGRGEGLESQASQVAGTINAVAIPGTSFMIRKVRFSSGRLPAASLRP